MSEKKYLDLAPRIVEACDAVPGSSFDVYCHEILRWLDEHPEAVPSSPAKPTITDSKYREHTGEMTADERSAFDKGLAAVGGAVVRDPKPPTNAERLADFLRRHDLDAITNDGAAEFARQLDADGVTAPGGEGRE